MLHVAPKICDLPSGSCRRGLSLPVVRQTSSCFLLNQFGCVVFASVRKAERLKWNGKEWLPYGDRPPSQKLCDGWTADAALAWTHAASRLQLCVSPSLMALQARKRNVLASAYDRVGT